MIEARARRSRSTLFNYYPLLANYNALAKPTKALYNCLIGII